MNKDSFNIKDMVKSKRSVSEIVGYVLLIVIALGIAAGVYYFIGFYIPKFSDDVCPTEDISLIVKDYSCEGGVLSLNMKNKGNFNIDGFLIWASNDSNMAPFFPLNATSEFSPLINNNGLVYFKSLTSLSEPLKPEEDSWVNFSYTGLDNIANVKIEPFVLLNGSDGVVRRDLCEKSIITQRFDGCGLSVVLPVTPPDPRFFSFEAEAGDITAPFITESGYIYQVAYKAYADAGIARYDFTVSEEGNYIVKAKINAPDENSNSVLIDMDTNPTDDTEMVWDIVPTGSLFENRTVSWRGNGDSDTPQFNPKIFTLVEGDHQLVIFGREPNVKIDKIYIEPYVAL